MVARSRLTVCSLGFMFLAACSGGATGGDSGNPVDAAMDALPDSAALDAAADGTALDAATDSSRDDATLDAATDSARDDATIDAVDATIDAVDAPIDDVASEAAADAPVDDAVDAGSDDALDETNSEAGSDASADAIEDACVAGVPCVLAGNACHRGAISCASGSPSCVDTGANADDGTSCGTDQVCVAGACTHCVAGDPCTPSNRCDVGVTVCTSGPACMDTSTPVANGTSCGTDRVCNAGACVACVMNEPCTPTNPCETGVLACNTGVPTCVATSNVADGTTCGTNRFCNGGACTDCVPAMCTPSNLCHQGAVSCTTGAPVCVDTGSNVNNGTPCGPDEVCNGGNCVACATAVACTPSNVCHVGATSCMSGASVCMDTGGYVADGTSCGPSQVCSGGSCVACAAGVACTPSNPCHTGRTSCSTGTSVCIDTGTNVADYTACGSGMLCTAGQCVACVNGAACTPPDPCQFGALACATDTCGPTGTNPATSGQACGASGAGVCTNGACACPAGQGYNQGDCRACPRNVNLRVYVDPVNGVDSDCCGVMNTPGFGGPCLTVTQAMRNVGGSFWTIVVSGTANAAETYPIQIRNGTQISGGCFPGVPGRAIFATSDNTNATLSFMTIGSTCSGTPGGASDAVYVSPQSRGALLSLQGVTIAGSINGVRVDGGTLNIVGANTIHDVTGDGIHCESSVGSFGSNVQAARFGTNPLTVYHAALHDIFIGTDCRMTSIDLTLGDAAPCPATKLDDYGIWVESNGFSAGFGRISCMKHDGISLHTLAGASTNFPSFSSTGTLNISHAGCAGVYAEAGSATITNATISRNHWGVIQRSAASSTDPTMALVRLNGTAPTGGSPNSFSCNGRSEPGACCAGTNCPNGADVWNNSGLPIDASNSLWDAVPVAQCTCNSALASCACTAAAAGMTTPPDGVSVVNAPLNSGGTAGTTNVTNAMAISPATGCF